MINFPKLGLEMSIERTAFTIGGLAIYWYAIIIVTALILAFTYATRRSEQFGMISDKVFDTALFGLIGAILGARFFFVIFSDKRYTFAQVFTQFRDGGLALYGGILGAVGAALIVMKLKKLKYMPVLDLAGLGFLLGISLGRWGNFFNQEAYGAHTDLPWGMTGSVIGNVPVHPCFLYESLWCLLGFAALHFYSKKLRTFDGEIFLLFVAWYGLGRSLIEHLRADSLMLGSFKVSQLIASITAGAAVGAFIYFKRKAAKTPSMRLYADTAESKVMLAEYEKELKLYKEKSDAKKALKQGVAESIIADDPNDEPETETEAETETSETDEE